jgi:hypothetical protein
MPIEGPDRENPLLKPEINPFADLEIFKSPAELARARAAYRRQLRDQRRVDTVQAALQGFNKKTGIYGFTKGQFSLIQLVTEALQHTGPADMVISTWTAANTDVTDVLAFCDAGLVTKARWLVDLTFTKRCPQLAHRIRTTFGDDAIRVAKNHAKFVTLGNSSWKVVIRTSMNLNHNPRFENFEIAHDPALYDFHQTIIDEVWQKQKRSVDNLSAGDIGRHFDADL